MKVKEERTGWRDLAMSKRHRDWGQDCPAVDIDFLMIEYDLGIPVALIEYKHEAAKPGNSSHPSYRAISIMATRAALPFFVVRYAGNFSWWRVVPINNIAQTIQPTRIEVDEKQYIQFLYKLRGRVVK